MVKIGMIFGDRYEILEKIGTGGMSDVYKAKDSKLSRNVAVKVLKQEFSENDNFVSKFRVEAQAAAGLMHPNIVNVYDVGEEQGIYYIVMELVEGITLKKYIEKKARLTYKEAVSIAIQVGLGIEAAHNNHIIHRDIKPQNIIISKDGKVKVTDFGIAKAATSNTITSNVMGSVHYTSPEQARGGYSDEKSDIYSLGVTMFEMLTGRVPFNGETTVAIAIKHIQEEMPSPREYVSEIPYCVEDIVLKCCEKSPDRRYQNMHSLVDDLKQALLTPEEDFVDRGDAVMDGGTRSVTEDEMREIKGRSADYGYQETYPSKENSSMRLADEEYYGEDMDASDAEEEYDYDPKMERITTILAIIAGIVIVGIIIVLAVRLFGNGKEPVGGGGSGSSPVLGEDITGNADSSVVQDGPALVTMKAVVGEKVDDARNELLALGLTPLVSYQESDDTQKGIVMDCTVAEGVQIEVGSSVTLTVGSGTDSVEMVSVIGQTYEQALSSLSQKGFTVNKSESYSDTVEAGYVISQNPDGGTKAEKGCVVTVTVSLGKEDKKVRVPNLLGLSEADAIVAVVESGLSVGTVTEVYSDEQAEGLVCYQSLANFSYVDPETTIDFNVSLGTSKKTYKCNLTITAPTKEEAPDYKSGTEVSIKLVGNDGKTILETKTSSFPMTQNYYGLGCSGGVMTMSYTVTSGGGTTKDDAGNEVTVPETTETKSFTRELTFTEE